MGITDRKPSVLRSLAALYGHGRLAGTGYLSLLPVDQGIEHSAGASFAPNPALLRSRGHRAARDRGRLQRRRLDARACWAPSRAATRTGSRSCVKINHNEFLSYPNTYDQSLFASVEQAFDMGAVAVGATVYFGSPESRRQIWEISQCFRRAHELGLATVLWCYLRNNAFKKDGVDYHVAADLTGQANHLGVTIEADIIKQKMAENNGGFEAVKFAKTHPKVYSELTTDHPIDLVRYQVASCYMGRAGLINSGGESKGAGDLAQAVRTAVINKRAGGMGLISGRKAFQKPTAEGVALLNAIQDVYLAKEITVA